MVSITIATDKSIICHHANVMTERPQPKALAYARADSKPVISVNGALALVKPYQALRSAMASTITAMGRSTTVSKEAATTAQRERRVSVSANKEHRPVAPVNGVLVWVRFFLAPRSATAKTTTATGRLTKV
jgi:hypothetical protein